MGRPLQRSRRAPVLMPARRRARPAGPRRPPRGRSPAGPAPGRSRRRRARRPRRPRSAPLGVPLDAGVAVAQRQRVAAQREVVGDLVAGPLRPGDPRRVLGVQRRPVDVLPAGERVLARHLGVQLGERARPAQRAEVDLLGKHQAGVPTAVRVAQRRRRRCSGTTVPPRAPAPRPRAARADGRQHERERTRASSPSPPPRPRHYRGGRSRLERGMVPPVDRASPSVSAAARGLHFPAAVARVDGLHPALGQAPRLRSAI